jgi:hypothetical protein
LTGQVLGILPGDEVPPKDAAGKGRWEEPPQERLMAAIDADEPILVRDGCQGEVIDPDDPPPVQVDQLAVEDFMAEQHLMVTPGEGLEFTRGGGEPQATIVESRDLGQ